VKLGGVRFEEVRGMRSPFLETGGDTQYQMMSEAGFEYDSSFMVGPHGSGGGAWPFTLDFPPTVPTYCTNLNCPRRSHPGIWQLPLNRWLGRSVPSVIVVAYLSITNCTIGYHDGRDFHQSNMPSETLPGEG